MVGVRMGPMNFNLVSIRSDSDRIETEVEICRGAIMQARAQSCCESCWSAQTMSPPEQSVLQRAWSQAPRGRLSPWMEAKAWGLREGWRDLHDGSEHGMLTWIAKRVTKGGGGNQARAHERTCSEGERVRMNTQAQPRTCRHEHQRAGLHGHTEHVCIKF